MTGKTSLDLAREYEARLEHYLALTPTLPLRAGKVNATAVARSCGFDRQILYKNKTCRAMLETFAHEQGLMCFEPLDAGGDDPNSPEPMVPLAKLRDEQRRISVLEKRLSEMTARNAALMTRLRQHGLIEDILIASGRRSRPPRPAPLFDEGNE